MGHIKRVFVDIDSCHKAAVVGWAALGQPTTTQSGTCQGPATVQRSSSIEADIRCLRDRLTEPPLQSLPTLAQQSTDRSNARGVTWIASPGIAMTASR